MHHGRLESHQDTKKPDANTVASGFEILRLRELKRNSNTSADQSKVTQDSAIDKVV